MKKLLIILMVCVLNIALVRAQCGPVCYDEVYEFIYPPNNSEDEPSEESQEPIAKECQTDFDCNKGEHNRCNKDGTEENYFCIEDYDTLITKCELTVKKSEWCLTKICNQDDDCYITTAITPQTFIDDEVYDCCNNTIGAFNNRSKEFWNNRLKYYFRDYCPKQKLECKELIDLSSYKAVCDENVCKLTKDTKEKVIETNVYEFLDGIVREGGYILVLGAEAPSSDSLAATDIISGIQRYSSGEIVLEAKLASEVTNEDKMILLGHPCKNRLIDLSCVNWPYKQGETLIKLEGNNLIVAGTSAEDTRSTAKFIANYKDYPFLKESDTILVTKSGLEIPEIMAEPRQENEETEEEIVEEDVSGKVQEKTSEIIQEKPVSLVEEPKEKKKEGYVPFTKRIWEWILSWFR